MLENYMQNLTTTTISFFTILYSAIAVSLIYYTEYGVYLVVTYLIYSAQSNSSYQHLNSLEANEHIGKLYLMLSEQENQIENLSGEIESLEHVIDNI